MLRKWVNEHGKYNSKSYITTFSFVRLLLLNSYKICAHLVCVNKYMHDGDIEQVMSILLHSAFIWKWEDSFFSRYGKN